MGEKLGIRFPDADSQIVLARRDVGESSPVVASRIILPIPFVGIVYTIVIPSDRVGNYFGFPFVWTL